MKNWVALKERYLRDNLPIRLGGIAANLARIKSFSQDVENSVAVESLLQESKWFIEWTAADAEIEIAAELVELQVQLACWQCCWSTIWEDAEQRMEVADRAKMWSEKVLNFSGLLAVN
jgi:hypothetical protein